MAILGVSILLGILLVGGMGAVVVLSGGVPFVPASISLTVCSLATPGFIPIAGGVGAFVGGVIGLVVLFLREKLPLPPLSEEPAEQTVSLQELKKVAEERLEQAFKARKEAGRQLKEAYAKRDSAIVAAVEKEKEKEKEAILFLLKTLPGTLYSEEEQDKIIIEKFERIGSKRLLREIRGVIHIARGVRKGAKEQLQSIERQAEAAEAAYIKASQVRTHHRV